MNAEQKDQIRQLHSSGLGYKGCPSTPWLLSANGREEANPARTVRSVGVLLCRHHTENRNDSVPHNATTLGGITMLY